MLRCRSHHGNAVGLGSGSVASLSDLRMFINFDHDIGKANTYFAKYAVKLLVVLAAFQSLGLTQPVPVCSWPVETSGTGITNVAYPDTNATYWTMPFDAGRWKSIVIKGTYPQSRFFSFVAYNADGSVVENSSGVESALNDENVLADPGNSNPFDQNSVPGGPESYTVTAGRTAPSGGSNFLLLGVNRLAWIIYRIYVPNKGLGKNAGVPLPTVTVIGIDGRSHPVPPCGGSDAGALLKLRRSLANDGPRISNVPPFASIPSPDTAVGQASCAETPLISWIPANTGGYFPNPANKYIATPGLCLQGPEEIVVVRGKGAVFPDTYNDGPVWEPADVALRYWSICNNDQRSPYPVVSCKADYQTTLDADGFYTYVVSTSDSLLHPNQQPAWVPAGATWIPWGLPINPKILIFRNMLPYGSFNQTVQEAIQTGCTVDNEPGVSPPRAKVEAAGACAHSVMQDYYPEALYCKKSTFIARGWQGCVAQAKH